jgi:hypothetical protein
MPISLSVIAQSGDAKASRDQTDLQRPDYAATKTELCNPAAAGPTTCRICGSAKEPHNFCCPSCWQRLPRELRAPFAVQKLRCLAWLREDERLERIEAEYLRPPECGSW